jgi:hypothetical protein
MSLCYKSIYRYVLDRILKLLNKTLTHWLTKQALGRAFALLRTRRVHRYKLTSYILSLLAYITL